MKLWNSVCVCFLIAILASCASLQPALENLTVKVTALRLLPSQGMQQRMAVDLAITNPNARDLSLRGISYSIGIENFDLLSGVTNQVPTLGAYQETPVTLEVSANLLEMVRMVDYFTRQGMGETVNYKFRAKLDFSRWMPKMQVEESGAIPLLH
jgi:LEA14-like dessication related protein